MEIDNINEIKNLMSFDSEDDFYYLQILQRKKENPQLGSNSRVIKNYYIGSIEYLEEKYPEIKELCKQFNARAMFRINRRSYEKVAFKALENMAHVMSNREFKFCGKAYDRAIGQNHNDPNKKWILDIDEHIQPSEQVTLLKFLEDLQPIGPKAIVFIDSKAGSHLITSPFNVMDFQEEYPEISIHKDNPTNLYIPE